jgi:hypothetical protein
MTTLSRGSHRDAETPVHTATHVAAPAPTGTPVPAAPWAGPASSMGAARASSVGAARASAARFPWTVKGVITAPTAARHRAVPLTWNLTQATDWDLAQATDWDLTQATGRNLRQAN